MSNSTPNQPTYSSVVANNLPPKVDQVIGRAAICAQQILLDPKPGTDLFPPGTSNKDIATRIREAIGNIKDNNTPTGYVRVVTTLQNGGVIVELDSEELAEWLRGPSGCSLL